MASVVFMFSGQGSHYFQMGRELFEREPVFRKQLLTFDAAAQQILQRSIIAELYGERRKGDLFNDILITHPALYMVQFALAKTLASYGINADCVLGASLGSYVASAVAGCVDPNEVLRLLLDQAASLQANCPKGGMIAVLAPVEQVQDHPTLRRISEIASFNFKSHFVLAAAEGQPLLDIERILDEQGVVRQRLAVSYAFHSRWIAAAESHSRRLLSRLQLSPGNVPIVCCARAGFIRQPGVDDFWRMTREPIYFQKTIEFLESEQPRFYIDLGPSGTLATFIKYILPSDAKSTVRSIMTPMGQDLRSLHAVLDETRVPRASVV